ncbi:regulatory protein RecX, partial [Pseudobutyrivibrio sp.]|uniref:regulatory protein RecX n=1 Tax=Pseudobutyrivibrio sp. TaxID=2014367 RepID=UPI00386A9175
IRFYMESRSKRRIQQDLMNKGIKSDVIERALEDEYTCDETDQIQRLLEKKAYNPDEATYEQKAKMYRFLAGRGYSSEAINRALN